MNKLNMWCGNDIKHWYLNVDIINLPWIDKVFNFEIFPYPFADVPCVEIHYLLEVKKIIDEKNH